MTICVRFFIGRKKALGSKIPYKIVKHSIGLGGGLTNDSKTRGGQQQNEWHSIVKLESSVVGHSNFLNFHCQEKNIISICYIVALKI